MSTTSTDPDEIRADIERTRAELSTNVDALTDTANPKNIANRQVDKVKGAATGLKDKIMGDAVSGTPDQIKHKTKGNPLAAGLIAFGAGLLISSLIPSSQKERDAVSGLQDNLEPLKEKATSAAKDLADNLRGPAEEAVASAKSTATDAVDHVKDDGATAKDEVQAQAGESKDNVQNHA